MRRASARSPWRDGVAAGLSISAATSFITSSRTVKPSFTLAASALPAYIEAMRRLCRVVDRRPADARERGVRHLHAALHRERQLAGERHRLRTAQAWPHRRFMNPEWKSCDRLVDGLAELDAVLGLEMAARQVAVPAKGTKAASPFFHIG